MEKLSDQFFNTYASMLDVDLEKVLEKVIRRDWSVESFRFYTAVSVIASSRIEGEIMEIDSYLKHKLQNIEYLPNLTEKPNDLYAAYEFARDKPLNRSNFLKAHHLATKNLLPENQRGVVRKNQMLIIDQQTSQVQYEAAQVAIVQQEFDHFWSDLETILTKNLTIQHLFYYASMIHLVFVKIHPFNDGNGRIARLLEKWFLASKIGEKAWYIGSENYYYQNLPAYYQNLARVGLFYDELNYEKSIPFLFMLPDALKHP